MLVRIASRAYAYQILTLEELSSTRRPGELSRPTPLFDDPHARLLTQIQGAVTDPRWTSRRRLTHLQERPMAEWIPLPARMSGHRMRGRNGMFPHYYKVVVERPCSPRNARIHWR